MMKNKLWSMMMLLVMLLLVIVACGSVDDEKQNSGSSNTTDVSVTSNVSKLGITYAHIDGYVNLNMITSSYTNQQIGVELSMNEEFDNPKRAITKELEGNKITVVIDTLSAKTKYYYRTFVRINDLNYYGEKRSFTTKDFSNITSTGDASDITFMSAKIKCSGDASSIDKDEKIRIGIVYSTTKTKLHPDSANIIGFNVVECSLDSLRKNKSFEKVISQLMAGTTYYYCSYTRAGVKYKLGEIKSFTTEHISSDLLCTGDATDISSNSAIIINNGTTIASLYPKNTTIEYGVRLSKSRDFNSAGRGKAGKIIDDNKFNVQLNGLEAITTYYYCAYAQVGAVLYTAEIKSFTTKPAPVAEGDGTLQNPFNCIAALNEGNELAYGEVSRYYYIKGKVVSVMEEFTTQYGTGTFYISEYGTSANQIYVNRVYYLGYKEFTNGDKQISVGDDVVICAKITNHYGIIETVPEEGFLYELNGENGGGEEIEGLQEDVYTIGNTDFTSGWWAVFSKYYQIPEGQKWVAQFNMNINPNATHTYKNFALIITNDEDRGSANYKEYGAIRYDFQPSGNSEWGDYIDRSLVTSTLEFATDTDTGIDQLGGKVTLTIDRSHGGMIVTMTNGKVTKIYKQKSPLVNLNADKTNTTIRAFLVPEGSYIDFLGSNIEPIGGFTSKEDKLPLSMTLNSVPRKVLLGTEMADAFANVSATVEFEQAVSKTVSITELTLQTVPDMNSLGKKKLVAAYNKSYKGESCNPVIATAEFEVVDKMYTSLGATDNSTPWWGAHSDNIKVAPNETSVTTFTNFTSGANNWNNFVIILCKADNSEYAVVRADNYGWGAGYDGIATTSGGQSDWASWLAAMDGAKVTTYVTNYGNGTADVKAVMLGTDGETYIQEYYGIAVSDPDDFYFRFTVDHCHLVFE